MFQTTNQLFFFTHIYGWTFALHKVYQHPGYPKKGLARHAQLPVEMAWLSG